MAINIDGIVNVNISIEKPMSDSSSFGSILLIGYGPADREKIVPDVQEYSSLEEIRESGWMQDEKMYIAAETAFLQEPKPEKIFIAVQRTVEPKKKSDTVEYENIQDTLNRALEINSWYGICAVGLPETLYSDIATWAESREKLFFFTYLENTEGEKLSKNKELLRTIAYCVNQTGKYDEFTHVAVMATCFSFAPGEETWALKSLRSVNPSKFTTLLAKALDEGNINYYVAIGNKNLTQNGKTLAGEWIDVIRFRDWLKNELQVKVLDLFTKYPKLPFTDHGISAIDGVMQSVLKNGQDIGGIAVTEYDEEGNEILGFTTKVPLSSSLTAEQKSSRTLTGCRWTSRLAGAIHCVEINGTLTN